jgi:uncharacterized protein YlxW (UPF0749 family)
MRAQNDARRRRALLLALLAAVIAFVAVIQVRSQAEVERSLEGQDNTSLAFLIDDLHRANDSLALETAGLSLRRDALRGASGPATTALLNEDAQRLRIIEGLVPVHGPGVVITIDAALQKFDLEDAINNLHAAGAEAIAINDRRITTGTLIRQTGTNLTLDGSSVRGPWTFVAIGDPLRLGASADLMTRGLRTDPKVRTVGYRSDADLSIRSVAAQRPYVYGSP